MKKLSMVVLLGIALSAALTGCNQSDNQTPPPSTSTNMPATPPSTNAP